MTVASDKQNRALNLAIRLFPLDLAARMNYIRVRQDTCDIEDLEAWQHAERKTRGSTGTC